MNMKKIWILAFIFGIIAACAVYFSVIQGLAESSVTQQGETQANTAEKEEDAEDTTDDASVLDIKNGKRAVSIPVNEVQGVAGFLEPNDRVDVIVITSPQSTENISAQILLQNIRILAAGATTKESESKTKQSYQTVTLEVTPNEGASLAAAAHKGTISLMLRKKGDTSVMPQKTVTLDGLGKEGTP